MLPRLFRYANLFCITTMSAVIVEMNHQLICRRHINLWRLRITLTYVCGRNRRH